MANGSPFEFHTGAFHSAACEPKRSREYCRARIGRNNLRESLFRITKLDHVAIDRMRCVPRCTDYFCPVRPDSVTYAPFEGN